MADEGILDRLDLAFEGKQALSARPLGELDQHLADRADVADPRLQAHAEELWEGHELLQGGRRYRCPKRRAEDKQKRGRVQECSRRTAVEKIGEHHDAEAEHDADSTVHRLRLASCGFGVGEQARPIGMLVLRRVGVGRRVVGSPTAEARVHAERALVVVEACRHLGGGLAGEHLLAVGKRYDGVWGLRDPLRSIGGVQGRGAVGARQRDQGDQARLPVRASRMSPARDRTLSLRLRLARWASTVLTERTSDSAISRLERPWPIRYSISRSRGVRSETGPSSTRDAPRCSLTLGKPATIGPIPSITRRITTRKVSRLTLSINIAASAPTARQSFGETSRPRVTRAMSRGRGHRGARRRHPSGPSAGTKSNRTSCGSTSDPSRKAS